MAFECYDCYFYVSHDVYEFQATDIEEAASWCGEMFFEKFDDSRFISAQCLYIDTEDGPIETTFGFYRDGSMVVAGNHIDRFVFEDLCRGEKLVDVNDLIEWVLCIAHE